MLESVQKLYDDFFKEIKSYLISHSMYSPYIFKNEPEEKLFPVVIIKELPRTFRYTTLKHTDIIYYFSLEINIYAMQSNGVSAITIADELTNLIEKYFYDNYKMRIQIYKNISNIDTSVIRNLIQIKCKVDTKYKDKLVLCP